MESLIRSHKPTGDCPVIAATRRARAKLEHRLQHKVSDRGLDAVKEINQSASLGGLRRHRPGATEVVDVVVIVIVIAMVGAKRHIPPVGFDPAIPRAWG